MKNLLLLVILFSTSLVMAGENKNPDAQAIDQACTQDAQTAGCGNEKVGTGLLKCLHAYKKEHKKEFKFSEGCKSAMKTWHEDNKAKREAKKEAKK